MEVYRSMVARIGLIALAHIAAIPAAAQAACSSDGAPAPTALIERFIDADCAHCWRDPASVRPRAHEAAIDWILPSPKGDEAPLSAVATSDAAQRLDRLPQISRAASFSHKRTIARSNKAGGLPAGRLRVAHGVALGGYMGASIEWTASVGNPKRLQPLAYPLTAWLTLVEVIPQGVEGSPVERLLVRNSLITTWASGQRTFESRPMSLPPGSNPEKLRVVGWVEDRSGQLIASASSQCR